MIARLSEQIKKDQVIYRRYIVEQNKDFDLTWYGNHNLIVSQIYHDLRSQDQNNGIHEIYVK